MRLFVRLLNEGTEVSRPVDGVEVGVGLFKLLPPDEYDPDAETWEFPPGSTVRVTKRRDDNGEYLLAIKP